MTGEPLIQRVARRRGVEDEEMGEAEELMDTLSARRARWAKSVFRGHADANWELKPSAVRDGYAFARFGGQGNISGWSERADALRDLLASFQRELNRNGLTIPAESPSVYDEHPTIHSTSGPPPEAYPLMALAQHHGLPTLFLDWTFRGWVAAYFAAAEAARGVPASSKWLAVWALDASAIDPIERRELFYQPPGETNPNLRAQSALFTRHEGEASLDEELLGRLGNPTPLRRILLPRAHARELLRLLALEGITGATLFPGADGVVRSLRERALWRE